MNKNVVIIGSGFSSLSASCYLAKAGYEVTIYEKNDVIGGRASQLTKDGFTFDMGPSWYWMPDIFDSFFKDFGKKTSDYYTLDKLSPAYKIFFSDDVITIGDSLDKISKEFERIEKGSATKLRKFISKAQENYDIAINKIVLRPGLSPFELVTKETLLKVDQFFKTISTVVKKQFKNPKLIATLEFPVLFLGAKASNTPSFYSFMNFADFGLGTWHPKGGMYQVIKAMTSLATELGVKIHTNSPVDKILVKNNKCVGIICKEKNIACDIVVSGADYHHSESLLDEDHRQYPESYWNKKTFAPSSLLFYIGFNKKLKNVEHHNLFFDTDFETHSKEIYDTPQWPSAPLFYANFPSISDTGMAPENCETGFFLVPIAPDLKDTPKLREQYFTIIMDRFELRTGQEIKNNILFMETFCVNDFKEPVQFIQGKCLRYGKHPFANRFLKARTKKQKSKALVFYGSTYSARPGGTPSLISGKLVSELIIKNT